MHPLHLFPLRLPPLHLFPLQSGANAEFAFDFSKITTPTAIVIVGGSLLALAMILFFLAKYVRKVGFLDIDKNNSIESSAYAMNNEIDKVDSQMRMKVRTITQSLSSRLRNMFYETGMCPVAVIAITNSALGPLYDSAANNHFTTVMLPENREEYLIKLLKAVEDEYRSTYNAMLNFECGNKIGTMPLWEGGISGSAGAKIPPKEQMQKFLMDWVDSVLTETIKSCMKKIDIYKGGEIALQGSKRWAGITAACIAKNEKYISLMDRHGKSRLADMPGAWPAH